MAATKSTRGKGLFAFGILGFLLLFELGSLAVIDINSLYRFIETEDRRTEAFAGRDQRNWIRMTAENIHRTLFEDTGIIDTIRYYVLPAPVDPDSKDPLKNMGREKLWPYVDQRITIFNMAAYLAIYRLAGLLTWIPVLAMFLFPLFSDALWTRKKKIYSFAYASPTAQRTGIRMVIFLTTTVLPFVLVSPWPVPPHLAPGMLMIAAISIWFFLRNLPKKI